MCWKVGSLAEREPSEPGLATHVQLQVGVSEDRGYDREETEDYKTEERKTKREPGTD